MARFFYAVLAILGAITLTAIMAAIVVFVWFSPSAPSAPDRIVLTLDLRTPPAEAPAADGIEALLGPRRPLLSDIVATLEQARNDDRVAGLLLLTGDSSPGFATIQELRDALIAFAAAGKTTVAFARSFGEGANGTGAYYLASAADEIWLQPSGDLSALGISAETPFLKDALDKAGITFEGGQRYEYKTAPNMFTQQDFTAAHRQNLQQLVDSLFSQFVGDVSKTRHIGAEQVRRLIDQAPLSAADALRNKLVDHVGYEDEAEAYLLKKAGSGAGLFSYRDYRRIQNKPYSEGPVIALVRGVGAIATGTDVYSLAAGERLLGADTVGRALRRAGRDPSVRAVVLRIDSPGGSYVASDTIYREVARLRAKGKPVIVSMGDVAASGGYFIALPADMIVASPGTLTGSVGVFGYKPVAEDLMKTLGINFDQVNAGANAGMNSLFRHFTPEQLDRLNKSLDRVYADFTKKVGDARKLSPSQVDAIARGRVWTGIDAKRVGLVDELGGLTLAIGYAKAAAGIEPTTRVRLRILPRTEDPMERLFNRLTGESSSQAEALRPVLAYAAKIAASLRTVGIGSDRGALTMPPVKLDY